jgi:hypothetical protein
LTIESHPAEVESNLRSKITVQSIEIDPSWGVISQSSKLRRGGAREVCEREKGEVEKLFRVDS